MSRLLLIFAMLLTCGAAYAQPDALDGPDTADPGSLVILDASGIASSGRAWQAINAPDGSYRVVDDAQRLVFATPIPGRYWFVFSFTEDMSDLIQELTDSQSAIQQMMASETPALPELRTAQDSLRQITATLITAKIQPLSIVHQVVITGDVPDPGPIIPDGKYQLAMLSRAEALKLSDHSAAGSVARAYRDVANQITAGTLQSAEGKFGQSIMVATGVALKANLAAEQAQSWLPFGRAISARVTELQSAGKIVVDADLATAYSEIATGLESIGNSPAPKPPVPVTQKPAWIITIEETSQRTPEVAAVLGDVKFWGGLQSKSIQWRQYDKDSADAASYNEFVTVPLPAVLFLGSDGKVLSQFPLPSSTAAIASRIGGH